MNKPQSLKAQAHQFILDHLKAGDIAIDATVGNGHDTLFLAKQVGVKGLLFGFDIQQPAIESAQAKLDDNLVPNTTLFNTSHENLSEFIATQYHGKIKAIMFNLGYLPGSDKVVITKADSTLVSLNQAIELLAPLGVITIMAYPGHPGGEEETKGVIQWCNQLNIDKYKVEQIDRSESLSTPSLFNILKI